MEQFGAIIFCKTFKNYFGQFVWIEKNRHYISRVSLHEAPTKTLANVKRRLENRVTLFHDGKKVRIWNSFHWTFSMSGFQP